MSRSLRRSAPGRTAGLGLALALALAVSPPLLAEPENGQRAALVELFEATDGENWTQNNNWLGPPGSECTWFGVSCFDDQILSLSLPNNNLAGFLPSGLAALSELRILQLRGNQIFGGFPPDFTLPDSIQALDLGMNSLQGPVPASVLTSPLLFSVWLDNNQLGSIESPGENPGGQLSRLWLDNNLISADSLSALAPLPMLAVLSLRNNALGSVPTNLPDGSFQALQALDIGGNPIGQLPLPPLAGPGLIFFWADSIGADDHLEQWLNDVAAAHGDVFPSLFGLRLDDNQLSGPLPAGLFAAPQLNTLHLADNALDGPLPEELFLTPQLSMADLRGNQFQGSLPEFSFDDWVGTGFVRLSISLSDNPDLSGPFPDALIARSLQSQMFMDKEGTALDFGECYGLRRVEGLRPPSTYSPDEPVEVTIWIQNFDQPGTPRVLDNLPAGWAFEPGVTPEPISSPTVPSGFNAVFRYSIFGPESPLEAEQGRFFGQLVPTGSPGPIRVLCGDDQGWFESFFRDRFEGAARGN